MENNEAYAAIGSALLAGVVIGRVLEYRKALRTLKYQQNVISVAVMQRDAVIAFLETADEDLDKAHAAFDEASNFIDLVIEETL